MAAWGRGSGLEELSPIKWAIRPLQRYADFKGRAPRAEYWWFILGRFLVGAAAGLLDLRLAHPVLGMFGPFAVASTLAFLVPGLAVDVRRLHDTGRSAWWLLLNSWNYGTTVLRLFGHNWRVEIKSFPVSVVVTVYATVAVCVVVKLIFMVMPGTEGSNRYGPNPYGRDGLQEVFA
jgi:uncharacterized membrane protein YhaH (DUF805 family)